MVGEFEHLPLPFIPEDLRRKKRKTGGHLYYQKVERDKSIFYDTEMKNFSGLEKSQKIQKRKFSRFFDPTLIYKIAVNQKVDENDFKEQLKKFDIRVIAPSPDKKGFWVVFAEDDELKKFKAALQKYTHQEKSYGQFFDAVEKITEIPKDEKIGQLLKEKPFGADEISALDFSVWVMDPDHLKKFLAGFKNFLSANNGEIIDEFHTQSFSKLKIRVDYKLLNEILSIKEIEFVDRPPKIRFQEKTQVDFKDFPVRGKPQKDSPGILIIDSGITSNHPYLKDSIGDAIAIATNDNSHIKPDDPNDDVGHGTQVAGVALYGDIQECISSNNFKPEYWIFSSKVMYKDEYGFATYDEKELLEHQLYSAVTRIIDNYPQCKIINLSLGNPEYRMSTGVRQFNIASLIDELAYDNEVIFTICAGNYYEFEEKTNYPIYFLDETTDLVKIFDTASSALGLTVGALYDESIPGTFGFRAIPAPYTRVGPGYRGMIKPDLVENGGGISEESLVITTNHSWISDHRLFCEESGTSYSAPKVAHFLAKIMQKYPTYSINLVKALLISATTIPQPEHRPGQLRELDLFGNAENQMGLLNIYGNGKPNIGKALFSERNRVLLLKENSIRPKHIHIYQFFLPKNFINTKGPRSITISLSFDPITNKNRIDYLGVVFEVHLFKNIDPQIVKDAYSETDLEDKEDEIIPNSLKGEEIKLFPNQSIRKKGPLQKGVHEFLKRPNINSEIPLTLVIVCQNRWVDENYIQNYAVVVSIEHTNSIDIYNQIRILNRARAEITL